MFSIRIGLGITRENIKDVVTSTFALIPYSIIKDDNINVSLVVPIEISPKGRTFYNFVLPEDVVVEKTKGELHIIWNGSHVIIK